MTKRLSNARNPQELERLWITRQRAGDINGMVALYEPDAILDYGSDSLAIGKCAIREVFIELESKGQKFNLGEQQPAIICGDIALTSTRFSDGDVTVEVARKQTDGTWLWVIDKFSIK